MEHIAKLFYQKVKESFDGFMQEHGFVRNNSHANEAGFSMTYRNGDRYINIGSSLQKQHHPYYFFFTLGEGIDEMPESDWNGVALWWIIQRASLEDHNQYCHIYDIPDDITEEQITEKIERVKELFIKYGQDFLVGDMTDFLAIRTEQNRGREPHKIYVLDKNGEYKLTYEEMSVKLKEVFS